MCACACAFPFFFLPFHVFRLFCRAFDVELLFIAQRMGIQVQEVAVNWTEIEGLILHPATDK